jgi:hypothetical protein
MRFCITLIVSFVSLTVADRAVASEAAALETIRADDLQRRVDVLADDTFEGREAGTRGGRAASIYVSKELAKAGVKPGAPGGAWFQNFSANYRNVLGVWEGSDPDLKDEWIILGAHYDHVGYGSASNSYGPTGYIHNGADDNASGTSTLLEIAEALASLERRPRRSILFAFWDGEEKGLLGSKHWLSSPTVPLKKVALAVNLDMVGRLRNNSLTVYGTRSTWGLRRQVCDAANGTNLSLDFTWKLKDNSDHWSFYERNVPILMLHTGLHDDYHRPRDDAHKINSAGMQLVTQVLFRSALGLADADELRGFRQRSKWESPYHRQELESPLAPLPTRLGVWWDQQDTGDAGLRLVRVDAGRAAAAAGLRVNDRLLEFDGKPMRHGDDLRAAVLQAGERVQVKIARAGDEKPLELEVALAGKPVRVGLSWREDNAEPGAVIVTRVVPGSPAAQAGLKIRERIYQFNGEDFASTPELLKRIQEAEGPVALLVESEGQLREVEMELPAIEKPAIEAEIPNDKKQITNQ